MAFETLAQLAGLNVIFDPDFRGTRIPIDLNNVDIYSKLSTFSRCRRGSFWKPVNRTTILVSPDNQTKRRDYDELVLKTIYLSNSVTSTEITEAITALRTLLNMRYLAQSTSMNAIIVRDTADRIAIAEKIIQDIDKAKPEVIVDATVLEVDRRLFRAAWNSAAGRNHASHTEHRAQAEPRLQTRSPCAISKQSTLEISQSTFLKPWRSFWRPTPRRNSSRIRACAPRMESWRRFESAQSVPVASGSFQPAFVGATGTPVVQFQYVDVGVNLDITPRVLLNREVSMTVLVQVPHSPAIGTSAESLSRCSRTVRFSTKSGSPKARRTFLAESLRIRKRRR